MNELLPGLYDHIEPVAHRIAARAAELEPADAQRAYLVGVARQIVESGRYRPSPPAASAPPGIEATLAWFDLLDEHLEDFVAGRTGAGDIIRQGGGKLWEAFQARDVVCAVYGHGVARALGPHLAGKEVLELGAGTGGTTRRLAADLRNTKRFVLSDVRQSFLDRLAGDLPGVPLETALVDIDAPLNGIGSFDVIFSTNCLHVAKDLASTLERFRSRLNAGGVLVLGEGSHYSGELPSPVSLVLALFDGWWNAPTSPGRPQQGFLLPEHWFASFAAAGFQDMAMESWGDDHRHFGGVYWAFNPR
ncbi:MAG: class I SAM-dependent methyltransferase [Acidimicrobiia bacterium]